MKLPPVAGAPLLQVTPLRSNETGGELMMPFQAPLKPSSFILAPTAMLPLKLALVTVTFAPVWVSVPSFQMEEIVCPLGKAQLSVQLVMTVDEVL